MALISVLDNISVNALRTNSNVGTNGYMLGTNFDSNGYMKDKYPYDQSADYDSRWSIRINDTAGPDGDPDTTDDNYVNYPIWTGDYRKWLFTHDIRVGWILDNDPLAYKPINKIYGPGDKITDLIGNGYQLVTNMAVETGGENEPLKNTQYLSVENVYVSNTETNPQDVIVAIVGNKWPAITSLLGSKVETSSGTKHTFGVSSQTHMGDNSPNVINEWDRYDKNKDDQGTESEEVWLSDRLANSNNGWVNADVSGVFNWSNNSSLDRELILRHPQINLYNNRKAYERGLTKNLSSLKCVPRGRSDQGSYSAASKNYGAVHPWAAYSYTILEDSITDMISDNPTTYLSAMDCYTLVKESGSTGTREWNYNGGPYKQFSKDKVLDKRCFDVDHNQYGGSKSDGTPLQWLSSNSDHVIMLYGSQSSPVDIIRIVPAMNSRWYSVGEDGYLGVNQIKELVVRLHSGQTIGQDVYKTIKVEVPQWLTSDIVLVLNKDFTEENATRPAAISFQITEVWDDTYDSNTNEGPIGGSALDNFGGIAEIYLYGKKDLSGDYLPIDTEVLKPKTPENAMRYTNGELLGVINSGNYWIPEGENDLVGYRGLSGGSYSIGMTVSKDDTDLIGSKRFNCDMALKVNTMSRDISAQYAKDVNDEIAGNLTEMLISLVLDAIITILVVSGIGAVLGWIAAGIREAFFGASFLVKALSFGQKATKLIKMIAILYAISVPVGLLCPELMPFIMLVTDIEDMLFYAIFNTLMIGIADTILSPKDHVIRSTLGPLLTGIYMSTFDISGTLPRVVSAAVSGVIFNKDPSEVLYNKFDEYELAMMRGEDFNWLDYTLTGFGYWG